MAVQALFRVVLERYLAGEVTNAGMVKRLFTSVMHENANRVSRSEVPLTYDEISHKWDLVNRKPAAALQQTQPSSQRNQVPVMTQSVLKGMLREAVAQVMSGQDHGNRESYARGAPPSKRAKHRESSHCTLYNAPGGCTNEPSGRTNDPVSSLNLRLFRKWLH